MSLSSAKMAERLANRAAPAGVSRPVALRAPSRETPAEEQTFHLLCPHWYSNKQSQREATSILTQGVMPVEVPHGGPMNVSWRNLPETLDDAGTSRNLRFLYLRISSAPFLPNDCTARPWSDGISVLEAHEYSGSVLPVGNTTIDISQDVFRSGGTFYFKGCIGAQGATGPLYLEETNVVRINYSPAASLDVPGLAAIGVPTLEPPDLLVRGVRRINLTGEERSSLPDENRNHLWIWFGADSGATGIAPPTGTFHYEVHTMAPSFWHDVGASMPFGFPGSHPLRSLLTREFADDERYSVYHGFAEVRNLGVFGWGAVLQSTERPLPSDESSVVMVKIDNCPRRYDGYHVYYVFTNPTCGPVSTLYPERNYFNNAYVRMLALNPGEFANDLVLDMNIVNKGQGWATVDVIYALQHHRPSAKLRLQLYDETPPNVPRLTLVGETPLNDNPVICKSASGKDFVTAQLGINRVARFVCIRPEASINNAYHAVASLHNTNDDIIHRSAKAVNLHWGNENNRARLPDLVAHGGHDGLGIDLLRIEQDLAEVGSSSKADPSTAFSVESQPGSAATTRANINRAAIPSKSILKRMALSLLDSSGRSNEEHRPSPFAGPARSVWSPARGCRRCASRRNGNGLTRWIHRLCRMCGLPYTDL